MALPAFSYLDKSSLVVFPRPSIGTTTDRLDKIRYAYEVQSQSGRIALRYVTKIVDYALFRWVDITETYLSQLDDFIQKRVLLYYEDADNLSFFVPMAVLTEQLQIREINSVLSAEIELEGI